MYPVVYFYRHVGKSMRGVIFLLAIAAVQGTANAATVVRFGARLCEDGQQMSNGTCIDKVQNECPSGYYETVIASATYSAMTLKNQCMNAYDKQQMPDMFHAIYSGVLVKYGATLCAADEQFAAGTCQKKEPGRCPEGSYKTPIGQSTFSSPSAALQECMNSYNAYELPEFLTPIYNGVLVAYGAKLCGAGQYLSDGECMAVTRGDCPENFHDITVDAATLTTPENAVCATGYATYWLNADCTAGQSKNNMCAILCEDGLKYTGLGTCAELCPHGKTELRASGGQTWPLWAEKLTTPALNIKTSDGVCYINFLPGAARGVMNIKSAAGTYHISD